LTKSSRPSNRFPDRLAVETAWTVEFFCFPDLAVAIVTGKL
jgi:hypothetical protein